MTAGRPSVAMAWSLVVLMLLAGYVVIASPLLELYEIREARSRTLANVIEERRALINKSTEAAARLERARAANIKADDIISARDTSAVAKLQEHLHHAAARNGLRVDTLRVLSDRALERLREVAVQASLRGSVTQAQRLVHGLESGTPLIRISRLTMLGRPGVPDLEITLEIAALAESTGNAD